MSEQAAEIGDEEEGRPGPLARLHEDVDSLADIVAHLKKILGPVLEKTAPTPEREQAAEKRADVRTDLEALIERLELAQAELAALVRRVRL